MRMFCHNQGCSVKNMRNFFIVLSSTLGLDEKKKITFYYFYQSWHSTEIQSWHTTETQSWHTTEIQSWHTTETQSWHTTETQSWHSTDTQSWYSTEIQSWHTTETQSWHTTETQSWHTTETQSWHNIETQSWHNTNIQYWNNTDIQSWLVVIICMLRRAWVKLGFQACPRVNKHCAKPSPSLGRLSFPLREVNQEDSVLVSHS